MPDYYVREIENLIAGQVTANSASEAAWYIAEQLVISQNIPISQEWLVFEVSVSKDEEYVTRVSIQFAVIDDVLEPVETPLALTLSKRNQHGRPSKAFRTL